MACQPNINLLPHGIYRYDCHGHTSIWPFLHITTDPDG